jgi:hypothetical protein
MVACNIQKSDVGIYDPTVESQPGIVIKRRNKGFVVSGYQMRG